MWLRQKDNRFREIWLWELEEKEGVTVLFFIVY